MGEKLVVGPINQGLRTDRLAFNIDDDSFPTLINAYQWRGRIKRKRGTSPLGRLTRYFSSASTAYGSTTSFNLVAGTGTYLGYGVGNLLTGFGLESTGNIVPGSVTFTDTTTGDIFTDPSKNGTLVGSMGGTGIIIYSTGFIAISGATTDTITTVSFIYYPGLPVLGLEDLILEQFQFPGNLGFDTTYSYNIGATAPYGIYDVSFYKNPPSAGDYTQKSTWTPTSWNGQDYRQFWTVNYQGALWATNGINVPYSATTANIGMQFKPIVAVTVSMSGPPAIVNLQITGHGLVVGDFLFINEVVTTTGINFQTGYVTDEVNDNNVTVEFPNATITTNSTNSGIAQYLTNRSNPAKDCLRWYDGDPTNGANSNPPVFSAGLGWVNFMPPLSEDIYIISDLPPAIYYLIGARMIVPYKDRLLFFGPVVQTSASGAKAIYLRDTVVYSQNGTPYYTCSYTNTPSATVDTPTTADTVFFPVLTPVNQTATSPAYFADQPGFGGFIAAGIDQAITSVQDNRDVLIIGFDRSQSKLVYSGNDETPFIFYQINSEYGTGAPFASINMDEGVLSRGSRGYIITNETQCTRFDPQIPDQAFQVSLQQNGTERFASQRDFIAEWVYFSYQTNIIEVPSNQQAYKFNNQTLQYNYRDQSWAIFDESYTTYGLYRKVTGNTWATIGSIFPTWRSWNQPWSSGSSTLLNPLVIAGNQQGFVVVRNQGTAEAASLSITSISGTVLTVPFHCLNDGDYIQISGIIGTVTYQGNSINGMIFSVAVNSASTITLYPAIDSGSVYYGGGVITRLYAPYIQTKQFPVSWQMARKTRLGVQQYCLTTTSSAQITLLIFLSTNAAFAYNSGPIEPEEDVTNDGLIYSSILYTCPESTNLGLSPANISPQNTNLQQINDVISATSATSAQSQMWHRINTSLIGDTVQLGFTLSDAQMRDLTLTNQYAEIELHSFIIDVSPSSLLS